MSIPVRRCEDGKIRYAPSAWSKKVEPLLRLLRYMETVASFDGLVVDDNGNIRPIEVKPK